MNIADQITAADGTEKFLIGLADGKKVESVLIKHKRTVCACVSSQVGCAMACDFSWHASALEYEKLYRATLEKNR